MLKFTAQTMVRALRDNNPGKLANYYVAANDRKYQVWERNPLSVPLWSEEVVKQKLSYLHNNPVRAGLCKYPEDYKYSSASVYIGGEDLLHRFILTTDNLSCARVAGQKIRPSMAEITGYNLSSFQITSIKTL